MPANILFSILSRLPTVATRTGPQRGIPSAELDGRLGLDCWFEEDERVEEAGVGYGKVDAGLCQ
jgi:hypothetical protein